MKTCDSHFVDQTLSTLRQELALRVAPVVGGAPHVDDRNFEVAFANGVQLAVRHGLDKLGRLSVDWIQVRLSVGARLWYQDDMSGLTLPWQYAASAKDASNVNTEKTKMAFIRISAI